MTSASHPHSLLRLLFGTTNRAKIAIARAALAPLPILLLTPDDLNIHLDVVEDGCSTAENAEKKARTYFAATRIPTLAIDGGLHIAAFPPDRQPGVFVKRIQNSAGEATDQDVLDHYRRELDALGGESECTWIGSIALAVSPDQVLVDTFSFHTLLTSRQRGGVTPGAPLDALTVNPASGRYYTELAWTERPDARWIFEFVSRHMPGCQ